LTLDIAEIIVPTLISKNLTTNNQTETGEWNLDKKLSDLKGIFVDLKNNSEKQ